MINKHMQFTLIFGINLFFCNSFLNASEIEAPSVDKFEIRDSSLFTPSDLGKIALFHDKDGFHILENNEKHEVKNYLLSRSLRNISKDSLKLKIFLNNGYITVNQTDNGEYLLEEHGRLPGGGPVAANIAYWLTKSICYGTAGAAVGGIAVATGGTAIAVVTGGTAAVSAGITVAAAGSSVVAGVSAMSGATAVGGAITTAGLVTEATLATVAVGTSAGASGLGIVGFIEAAALTISAAALALPIP